MKKILIISNNALSFHENNGKTISSIFEGRPDNSVAQIYFNEEIPQSNKFSDFYRVTDFDILKNFFRIKRTDECGEIIYPVDAIETSGSENKNFFKKIKNNELLKIILRNILYGTNLWFSKKLDNWIKSFKPEHIFFVGGNYSFAFDVMAFLSKKYSIDYSIYITDDYIINADKSSVIKKIINRKLNATYKKYFKGANQVFVIGDDMADAFGSKFSRHFIPIMNSVIVPETFPVKNNVIDEGVVFLYAGGFHLGRDKSLIAFGDILQRVRELTGVKIIFHVYSFQKPNNFIASEFSDKNIIYHEGVGKEKLFKVMADADFVLHVESFDDEYIRKTKLSVSTKIPEYLSSGACLVAYGPSSVASMRIVDGNRIGVCISEVDDFDLACKKIADAVLNRDISVEIAKKGYEYAKIKFDKNRNVELMNKFLDL